MMLVGDLNLIVTRQLTTPALSLHIQPEPRRCGFCLLFSQRLYSLRTVCES